MNKLLKSIAKGFGMSVADAQRAIEQERQHADFKKLSDMFGVNISTQNQKRLLLMGAPHHIIEKDLPSELYKMQNHLPI